MLYLTTFDNINEAWRLRSTEKWTLHRWKKFKKVWYVIISITNRIPAGTILFAVNRGYPSILIDRYSVTKIAVCEKAAIFFVRKIVKKSLPWIPKRRVFKSLRYLKPENQEFVYKKNTFLAYYTQDLFLSL